MGESRCQRQGRQRFAASASEAPTVGTVSTRADGASSRAMRFAVGASTVPGWGYSSSSSSVAGVVCAR